MKKTIGVLVIIVFLGSCSNSRIEALEAENRMLKHRLDSLVVLVEEEKVIAEEQATLARIAEDSALAMYERLKDIEDKNFDLVLKEAKPNIFRLPRCISHT